MKIIHALIVFTFSILTVSGQGFGRSPGGISAGGFPAWGESGNFNARYFQAFKSLRSPQTDSFNLANSPNFGSPTAEKWSSGILMPNGKIFCIPIDSGPALVFDPVTYTYITTNVGTSGNYWFHSSALAPNGNIYMVPFATSAEVSKFSTTTYVTTQFAQNLVSGANKYVSCVLGVDGNIYGIPFDFNMILKIDPITDTWTTNITVASGSSKWIGGVTAPNGKIYCAPHNATTVLIINPTNGTADTATITGLSAATAKYWGAVLAPNGKIYCIPNNATNVLIINPENDTAEITSISGLSAATAKWAGGVLAPNGKIYCAPYYATNVLVIDPTTDTATTTLANGSLLQSGDLWSGLTLGLDGRIYCTPRKATNIMTLLQPYPVPVNFPLSRYSNKF